MTEKLVFEPKARLLLQLGDQLIRSESIALLELIKNSYDAFASHVRVSMKRLDDPGRGEITIEDDGVGMDSSIIKNVWMQPGSDYKLKIVNQIKNPAPGERIPIGEKGIGRFGAHKLGYQIDLVSRAFSKKEVHLHVNWRNFEQDDFLKNIFVSMDERDTPGHFLGEKTGTRIVITDLRNPWTRGTVRELYRSVNSLNSPFETLDSFKVDISVDKPDWIAGLLSFEDIEDFALYYAEATLESSLIKSLHYDFRPWDTMTKLHARSEDFKNIRMVEQVFVEGQRRREMRDLDLNRYKIGPIRVKLLIFDRENKILSLGVTDKKGFRDYLNQNGGVRVFRNGIRVYDYGEPSNDWLNLDIMRVNQPGETISNNIVIGAVNLDRRLSSDLEEKTNREGFVENEAFFKFSSAVRFVLAKILTQRNLDKDKVRTFYGATAISEPVIGNLRLLQEKVETRVTDVPLRDELVGIISEVEKDYKFITDIYTRSSTAGLSLGIVIHEVGKIIDELVVAVEELHSDAHVIALVKTLHKTVSDYAAVIKQSPKAKQDLVELVDQSLSNIQFRLKAHQIEVIRNYRNRASGECMVKCTRSLVIGTIINIVDNSIWWENYANVPKKKLLIDITDDRPGYTSILIADNGPGFSIPTEDAVKPFVSDKPDGMGLGLHLADEVMKGNKGALVFPEEDDFDIPNEFRKGARILLAFRKLA
jgi:signal transduction histidine kinase